MYEINARNLTTADRDFLTVVMPALQERFQRFHARHNPGGAPLGVLSQRKRTACSIATIITQTSLAMMDSFCREWYAPGLMLLRPTLEGLLRVAALSCRDDKSDWESILFNEDRFKVRHERLTRVARDTGLPDLGPLWKSISGPVNDLMHQRAGQVLTAIGDESEYQVVLSNPIERSLKPVYHASLVWEAAFAATMAVAGAHCMVWELLGDEQLSERCRGDLQKEDWDRIKTSRNGQIVYIVCQNAE